MRFTEINLFGVYVAPISLMLVVAWVFTIGLRRFAARRSVFISIKCPRASFCPPG